HLVGDRPGAVADDAALVDRDRGEAVAHHRLGGVPPERLDRADAGHGRQLYLVSDVVAAEDLADRRVLEDGVERVGDDRSDRPPGEALELLLARDRQTIGQHDLADRRVAQALDRGPRQDAVRGEYVHGARAALGQ